VKRFIVALMSLGYVNCTVAADKEKPPSRNQHFGAIAYHLASNSSGWATDRKTSREARLEALKQCGHEQCVIVGTVTRGCAALATNTRKFIVQKGVTQQEAQTKALSRCGARCEIAAWTCTR
jgi:hypothetical protein